MYFRSYLLYHRFEKKIAVFDKKIIFVNFAHNFWRNKVCIVQKAGEKKFFQKTEKNLCFFVKPIDKSFKM